MNKYLTILLIILPLTGVFAQTDTTIIEKLNSRITEIEISLDSVIEETYRLKENYGIIENSLSVSKQNYNKLFKDFSSYKYDVLGKIDSLEQIASDNISNIERTGNALEDKIDNT